MRSITLDQPYSYEDLIEDIKYLENTYPDLVKVEIIGVSHDGRDIPVIEVGKGSTPIIITAGVHGRESINPLVIMRIIESYLELYRNEEAVIVDYFFSERLRPTEIPNRRRITQPFFEMDLCTLQSAVGAGHMLQEPVRDVESENEEEVSDTSQFEPNDKNSMIPSEYDIFEFLNLFTLYIVPLLNPDGYEIALEGFEAIKDPQLRQKAMEQGIPANEWKANARGVDINRNFPSVTWRPKNSKDQPASENETKALMKLFSEVPAIGYLDLHSRGKAIYYYKSAMPKEYNRKQLAIAQRIADVTGYEIMPPESEIEAKDSGGNTVHYFSEVYHQPAITVETVTDMEPFPLDIRFQSPTFQEIYLVPLEFIVAILEE